MGKRVLVILGHPSGQSFCAALANQYAESANSAGNEVRLLKLGDLRFDPILHEGYNPTQPLEPDLLNAQAAITWAEHLVFVFPIWWGGIPALMKGFLDRILLPGFAFQYRKGKAFPEQRLTGKTAHLLVTMDTPTWYYKWVYHMPAVHQMRKTTLAFCGIKTGTTLTFGPLIESTSKQRDTWLKQVSTLASA